MPTIRQVALDAFVSPALVLHHFGSKAGLREACDAHVLELVRDKDVSALLRDTPASSERLAPDDARSDLARRYLARALTDGSPAAAALFDHLTGETERLLAVGEQARTITESEHPADRAAVLLSMQLGTLVLHEHLSRALAVEVLSPSGALRVARSMLEVIGGLMDPRACQAALAALDTPPEETT